VLPRLLSGPTTPSARTTVMFLSVLLYYLQMKIPHGNVTSAHHSSACFMAPSAQLLRCLCVYKAVPAMAAPRIPTRGLTRSMGSAPSAAIRARAEYKQHIQICSFSQYRANLANLCTATKRECLSLLVQVCKVRTEHSLSNTRC